MKRMLWRWLILSLCICMAATSALAANMAVLPKDESADVYRSIRHVEQVGEVTYLLTASLDDLQLWRWTKGMPEAELITDHLVRAEAYDSMETLRSLKEERGTVDEYDLEHAISAIFTDGEKLYGFNHLNSLVFTIDATAQGIAYEDVITLPDTRVLFDRNEYSGGYYAPIDVMKAGNWMLWHRAARTSRAYEEVVIAFHLETGAVKQAVLPGLKSMAPYRDGTALVICEGTEQALYVYDPEKDTASYIGLVPKGLYIRDAVYSDAMDMIIYQDRTRIMGWTADGVEQLGYIPTANYASLTAAGDHLLFTTDDQVLTASELRRGYATDHSLTTMGHTMYTLLGRFAAKYQDVPIYYMDRPAEETCQQILARKQNAPDLLYLHSHEKAYEELLESGALLDLSAYEDIKAYTESLYPAFRTLAVREDGIYAVPVSASSYNGWFINKEVMNAMGFTREEIPTSLTELCAFATRWNNEYAAKYPHYTLLNNTQSYRERILEEMLTGWSQYCQYHEKELTFDDPIIREMLAALDAAELKNLDEALRQTNPEVSEYKQALIWTGCKVVGNWGSYMEEYSDRIFIPLTLTPETDYVAAVQNAAYWVVNAKSENAEYAAAILAELIESLDEKTAYTLRMDKVDPVLSDSYAEILAYEEEKLASLESRLDESVNRATIERRIQEQKEYMNGELLRSKYTITPSSIANYMEVIAPVSFIYTGDALTGDERSPEIAGCIKRYINGTLTTEKFIAMMNDLLAAE